MLEKISRRNHALIKKNVCILNAIATRSQITVLRNFQKQNKEVGILIRK